MREIVYLIRFERLYHISQQKSFPFFVSDYLKSNFLCIAIFGVIVYSNDKWGSTDDSAKSGLTQI